MFHQSCCEVFLLKSFTVVCHEKLLAVLLCETTEQNVHLSSAFFFLSHCLQTPLEEISLLLEVKRSSVWQFHSSVNNLSELQFLAQLILYTKVSSPFVCSVTSLKLKVFFFHIDNVLHVHMRACVSICLDMLCVIPIYTQYKCIIIATSPTVAGESFDLHRGPRLSSARGVPLPPSPVLYRWRHCYNASPAVAQGNIPWEGSC